MENTMSNDEEMFAEMLLTDDKVINDMSSVVRKCLMSIKSFSITLEYLQTSKEIKAIVEDFINRTNYDVDSELMRGLRNYLGKCAYDLIRQIQTEQIEKLLTPNKN